MAVVTRCFATVSTSLRGSALSSPMLRESCGVTSSMNVESAVSPSKTHCAGVPSMGRRSCKQASQIRPTDMDR